MQRSVVVVALLVLLSRCAFGAAEFCALRVKVLGPEGSPVETDVVLRDETGKARQTGVSDRDGVADFCDVGFGLFDVVVGSNMCGQVVVKYLSTIWPHTRQVDVTYHNCHSNIPPSGCEVLLRIHSTDDRPVKGVSFTGIGMPSGSATDSYGRLMAFLLWGKRLEGVLAKPGYEAPHVSILCQPGPMYRIEEVIHLRPTGSPPR